MKISFKAINLPFKYPFTISKGTKTHQPSLLTQIDFLGIKGFGEAPAITYYNITVEKMIEDLEAKRNMIERFSFTQPERFWHFLHHLIPGNPFLVCALDIAGWDLYGKLQKQSLYRLWKGDISRSPVTDYTIGIDTIDKMVSKMNEKPWPVYKIKLGTDRDIEIITELRKHTSSVFRIDANAAWTKDEALEKIKVFKDLGVEFIEQPLAKEDWEGMRFLYEHSPLPLIADESCVLEDDVKKCYQHFHGINIKLTKCSGITPALRMMAQARELNMKVMIGSMNESSVGTSAIAQLMPFVDYADADGPLLLAEDVATGVDFDQGRIIYSNAPGIGALMDAF
ncbi:MAG TPA: dipeptide epimerase [Chitinophagaceae bacterium]|nr:dipeptide epimerase [Chitinophagaceae bacterium]